MKFSVFRMIVCLILCVSLIFGSFRPKAEAVLLESGLAIGIAACLILATAGVVFNPETVEDIKAIGNSFQTYMYQWGTEAEKDDEVQAWFGGLSIYDGSAEDDGSWESPNDTKIKLAKGILAGITAWVGSVILNRIEIETEGEEAPEGYAYYNGVLLKSFNSNREDYPYVVIYKLGSYYFFVRCELPFYFTEESSGSFVRTFGNCTYWQYLLSSDGSVWSYYNDASVSYCYIPVNSLIWCNHDVFEYVHNGSDYVPTDTLYLPASEPSQYYLEPIFPFFVGDIPSDLQEGNITEEEIPLVDIDYSQVLPQGQTALQSIQSLAGQLESGSMTYEDYLEKIKIDSESDSGGDTETDGGTDTGTLGQIQQDSFWAKLTSTLASPFEWLADTVMSGIKSIFVPSEDFISDKVDTLMTEFSFIEPVVTLVKAFFGGIDSTLQEPPVIYINLDDTRGSYDIGGKTPFIDMTWYAEYKPTVDKLLSAFLVAVFLWRLFRQLPGIVSGMPGDFVMDGLSQLHIELPSRKAGYEIQRIANRESIRKGPKK